MSAAGSEATARRDDPGAPDQPDAARPPEQPSTAPRPVAVPARARRRRARSSSRRSSGTLLFLVGALLVLGIGAVVILVIFPTANVSSRSATLDATPAAVYALLADVERYPAWRTGSERVEILEDDGAGLRFREYRESGAITYRVEVAQPPTQFRVRVEDADVPFEGTWTFALADGPLGAELTILEAGHAFSEVYQLASYVGLATPGTKEQLIADLRGAVRAGRQEP
jgi:hypothetical protein